MYFWDTCYLRFAADDYDPSNLDIYLHLSNNSIAKYYEKQKDGGCASGCAHARLSALVLMVTCPRQRAPWPVHGGCCCRWLACRNLTNAALNWLDPAARLRV